MAHDFYLDNQSGAAFRADLNAALAAAVSNSVGVEPTTKYAGQLWWDYANALIKIRNYSNTAWVTFAGFDGATLTPYRAGTATGTAAVKNTGAAEGEVALLSTGGKFAAGVLPALAGATSSVNGTGGLVPQPLAADDVKVLWGGAQKFDYGAALFPDVVDLTVGTQITGIRDHARHIAVAIDEAQLTGNDLCSLQLGTALAWTTSGYTGRTVRTGDGTVTNSDGFWLWYTTTSGFKYTVVATLTRMTGNRWTYKGSGRMVEFNTPADHGHGSVTLPAPLTRLQLLPAGSNTFSTGAMRAVYW
jgi:hypothetical protein